MENRCCPRCDDWHDAYYERDDSDEALSTFQFLTLLERQPTAPSADWREWVTPDMVIAILKAASLIIGFDGSRIPTATARILQIVQNRAASR